MPEFLPHLWRSRGRSAAPALPLDFGGEVPPLLSSCSPRHRRRGSDLKHNRSEKFRSHSQIWKDSAGTGENLFVPVSVGQNHPHKVLKSQLIVDKYSENVQHTFLDYLAGGYELNFMVAIDFTVEQQVNGHFLNFFGFNGTAGVWRIKALKESGGWMERTTVEDMDIAVRAHLHGWKFIFLNDVEANDAQLSTMVAEQIMSEPMKLRILVE